MKFIIYSSLFALPISLEKSQKTSSITAGDECNILGITLKAVAHSEGFGRT